MSALVSRFNQEGLDALLPRHGVVFKHVTEERKVLTFGVNLSVSQTWKLMKQPLGR